MNQKNFSENDLTLLKCFYNEFDIKDAKTKIDLFCMLKQLDDKLSPQKIKKLLLTAFDSEFYSTNKEYISKYNDTNYFGVIRRKCQKSGVTSIFHYQKDFLNAFLKRYPSPQDVNLPFWNWDLPILQHYLKLVYKKDFKNYILKKVLRATPTHDNNPFLSSCRTFINSNKYSPFVWYIRFTKTGKFFNYYIPIRFDCKNLETNSNSLQLYKSYIKSEHIPKLDPVRATNNIFSLLQRCIPKTVSPENCIFLIISSPLLEKYFKKEFLDLQNVSFLETKFVFISVYDIKTICLMSSCDYLKLFYEQFKPCRDNLSNCIKNCQYSILNDTDYIKKIRPILNKHFP